MNVQLNIKTCRILILVGVKCTNLFKSIGIFAL